MTPHDWHRARNSEWTARRDRDLRTSTTLSRLRLAAFLVSAAVIWFAFAQLRGSPQSAVLAAGAAGFVVFGMLVVRHARVLNDIARAEAALRLIAQAQASLARDWNALPEVPPPAGLDFDAHPYARDLDVFGHASLTKWLGRPATADGTRRLHGWLLAAADTPDIAARVAAVDELAPKRAWRESLAVEGELTAVNAADLETFLAWAESNDSPVPPVMQAAAILVPMASGVLLALALMDRTEGAWWLIPFFVAIVLSAAYAGRMYDTFDRATVGERALERYATMLRLVCDERWASPLLERVKAEMCVGGEAPAVVAKLSRLGGWSKLRIAATLLHIPLQVLTMWDFHVYFGFQRWRARSGRHVRGWIDALGTADALAVLARIRADQPEWVFPRVDAAAPALVARSLGHPLISDARRIANDVDVGPRGTLLLITGSNMSGKSTLLRAVGLNAVLAQAGAPVCAASFTMPPADLHTSIRVQDSLELGLSYFMAALARLKQIVDAADRRAGHPSPGDPAPRVLFYLLDEVLQGTNSVERGVAVRAVVRHLLDAGAIGVMTTHDLALAGEEPLDAAARLAHFTEQVHADGRMTFDYRLRPGIATSTNALRLMQLIGIPAT